MKKKKSNKSILFSAFLKTQQFSGRRLQVKAEMEDMGAAPGACLMVQT